MVLARQVLPHRRLARSFLAPPHRAAHLLFRALQSSRARREEGLPHPRRRSWHRRLHCRPAASNARHVAGAALLGQRERHAVLAQKRLHLITLIRSEHRRRRALLCGRLLGLDPRFASTPAPQIRQHNLVVLIIKLRRVPLTLEEHRHDCRSCRQRTRHRQ